MSDKLYEVTHNIEDVTEDHLEIHKSVGGRLEFMMRDNKSGETVTMFLNGDELNEIADIIDDFMGNSFK